MVQGDAERISQILSAFLSNAIAYSTKNTVIEIIALAEKKHLSVKIVDHGKGIPLENQAFIFNQFYRIDQSRSKKEHFGLGLSIA